MIVRVPDVPNEGLEVVFDLDSKKLAERLNASAYSLTERDVSLPSYGFKTDLPVKMMLNSDGRTVEMKGTVQVDYVTQCARCTGDAVESLNFALHIFVKPKVSDEDEEDIDFALYKGEDLDSAQVLEEFVVSKLPFSSLCDESCKGLCANCGTNLNKGICACDESKVEEVEKFSGPFSKLKDFKIVN
jgi:uncharacterized protein